MSRRARTIGILVVVSIAATITLARMAGRAAADLPVPPAPPAAAAATGAPAAAGAAPVAPTAVAAGAMEAPRPRLETGWGLPYDASPDGFASRIDWLIQVTNAFVGILFVIMVIWMLWAVFAHGKAHKAEYDHGNAKASVRTAMLISALIFFVVDGNLWVNATLDINNRAADIGFWNYAKADAAPGVLRIEINAHQWAWDARYAGPDGRFDNPGVDHKWGTADDVSSDDDVVTLNDIRVPVGVPVLLQLASVDVIHSFYLPNFRTKSDAVPGMINSLWFIAKETGAFEIACAQHCGTNHYKMRAILTVLSGAGFEAWLKEASDNGRRAYDRADPNPHWGWDWRKY